MRRFSAFITVSVMLTSTALAEPGAFGQRNAQRVGFQTEAASPPGATIEPEAIVAPKTKLAPKAKPKPKTAAPVQHERVVMRNDPRPSIFPGAAEMIVDAAKRYRSIADQGDFKGVTEQSDAWGVWRPGPPNVLVEGLLHAMAQGGAVRSMARGRPAGSPPRVAQGANA